MLVMMSAQELANGISSSGHMYAMTRAGRCLTPAGGVQETFGGMEQVRRRTHSGYQGWEVKYRDELSMVVIYIESGFYSDALVNTRLPVGSESLRCRANQVKFMKRIAEMSDLSPVLRSLPRIKKHILNPDNMR